MPNNNRKITRQDELVDWLVKQFLEAKPQRMVSGAAVAFFKKFASFYRVDLIYTSELSQFDFISIAMSIIARPEEPVQRNDNVDAWITAVFCELLVLQDKFDLGGFVETTASFADLSEYVIVKRGKKVMRIFSTSDGEDRFGVIIDVKVDFPRKDTTLPM